MYSKWARLRYLGVIQGLMIYDALDPSFGVSLVISYINETPRSPKSLHDKKIHPRRKLSSCIKLYKEKLASIFLKTITIIFTQKYIRSWHYWLIVPWKLLIGKLLMGTKANYLFCICIHKETKNSSETVLSTLDKYRKNPNNNQMLLP